MGIDGNEEFAKKHNFEKGKRYIEILSNKDNNGQNTFRLWFYHKYFYDTDYHWKGQTYLKNVLVAMIEFENVTILPTNFNY